MTIRRPRGQLLTPLLAALVVSAGVLLGMGAVALARELLTVVQRETAIRKEKRLLSPKVAVLKEGDQVAKLDEDGSWYKVEFQGQEGWLPNSSLSSDKRVVLSGQAAASGVRATEQSAGARGFNPEVESRHRASRSDLAAAYRALDRIQEKRYTEDRIARFVREGRLGDLVAEAPGPEPAAIAPASTADERRPARVTPPWKR
jgi:Bacterial SH3 domain